MPIMNITKCNAWTTRLAHDPLFPQASSGLHLRLRQVHGAWGKPGEYCTVIQEAQQASCYHNSGNTLCEYINEILKTFNVFNHSMSNMY